MRLNPKVSSLILSFACFLALLSCRKDEPKPEVEDAMITESTLVFMANGEDFVRKGFTDREGWGIDFTELYVNINEPEAYLAAGSGLARLAGSYWVDLAAGDSNAAPIELGHVSGLAPGNYQSLRFSLKRNESGNYAGFTIVMKGTARRDDESYDFVIKLDEEMDFDGREGYVGDTIKGMVKPGDTADVEMTFHFDHIFGDSEAEAGDHINTGSVGFDFFRSFAEGRQVIVEQNEMRGADGYNTLVHAIWTLGHLGEGHCEVSKQTSAGKV